MKYLILALALTSVNAKAVINCEKLEPYAQAVMTGRQAGVSLKDLLVLIHKQYPNTRGEKIRRARQVAMEAYSYPKYQTLASQRAAINSFANNQYLTCLKGN